MKKISVMIVSDHVMFRKGLGMMLEEYCRFSTVSDRTFAETLLPLPEASGPVIILLDGDFSISSFHQFCRIVHTMAAVSTIIVLAAEISPKVLKTLIDLGIKGYIPKSSSSADLIETVHHIASGSKIFPTELIAMIRNLHPDETKYQPTMYALSIRQIEICEMLILGKTSKEISLILGIAIKTVEAHRYNIMKRLKIKNIIALVNLFASYGISTYPV